MARPRPRKIPTEQYFLQSEESTLRVLAKKNRVAEALVHQKQRVLELEQAVVRAQARVETLQTLGYILEAVTEIYDGVPLQVRANKSNGGVSSPCRKGTFTYYQNASNKSLYGAQRDSKFLGSRFSDKEPLLEMGRQWVVHGKEITYADALLLLEIKKEKERQKLKLPQDTETMAVGVDLV